MTERQDEPCGNCYIPYASHVAREVPNGSLSSTLRYNNVSTAAIHEPVSISARYWAANQVARIGNFELETVTPV